MAQHFDQSVLNQACTNTSGSKTLRIKNVLQLHFVSPQRKISIPNAKAETPRSLLSGALLGCKSLTMTYFHTGTRTIIGAKSFHCPVRDGKEWYQLAMVIRHNLVSS